MSRRTDAIKEVMVDVRRHKPVRMTLENGRSRAFENLSAAVEWADNQKENKPLNKAKVAVSMAPELKEFIRDSTGNMSKTLRGLAEKAAGAQWKATKKGADKAPIKLGQTEPRPKVKTKRRTG